MAAKQLKKISITINLTTDDGEKEKIVIKNSGCGIGLDPNDILRAALKRLGYLARLNMDWFSADMAFHFN
jgi:hypothetical protein